MKKACLIITWLLVLLIVISVAVAVFRKNVPLGDRIALVTVKGPILDSKETIEELKDYVKDQSVKAIVLRVDSPGGAVAPSQEIYQEVKRRQRPRRSWSRWDLSEWSHYQRTGNLSRLLLSRSI